MRALLRCVSAACAALAAGAPLAAQNCQQTSVGFTPLIDLGAGTYQGFQGGLYPGGSNARPAAHHAAGLAQAAGVVPRDASGAPDPLGRVAFVSIGMSNTRNHWQAFMELADADPDISPRLTLVQGAQGGQTADATDDPAAPYWDFVQDAVQQAGATNAQVQVIWMLQANAQPSDPFPQHALALREQLETILQIVRDLFPNARLAYVASRMYAGYATTALNPEPWAYENGFALKWLVEDQIGGDAGLEFDLDEGPVEAPWLSWGGYTWADGLVPRSDGLVWVCPDDYMPDGTHPSPTGSAKVGGMVLDFLKSDPVAQPWLLGTGGRDPISSFCAGDGSAAPCPCANAGAAGAGCRNSASGSGSRLTSTGTPSVSADDLSLAADELPPGATVLFFQGLQAVDGGAGIAFGDGLRCIGGGVIRLAIESGSSGSAQFPGPGDGSISSLGLLPPAGGLRHYQAWYRDPAPAYCAPATFNFSNALRVEWMP